MLITKIRNKDGSKLTVSEIETISAMLSMKLISAGFKTQVHYDHNKIKIANNGCSFTINVAQLGYNARINRSTIGSCKTGFKRTATPTWTQREEFNHIVNNVLDKYKLNANIKSGTYIIRDFGTGRVNAWVMPEVTFNYGLQVPSVLEIVPLKYADAAVGNYGTNDPFSFVPVRKPRFSPRGKRYE